MIANATAMRPEVDVMGNLPFWFAFLLLGFFAFAYAYAKGYEEGHGVLEGVRFGVLAALIVNGFGIILFYVQFPITGSLAGAMVIHTVVALSIYGAIYRPLQAASALRAAV
jgi:uncharacterized membrane protein